MKKLNILWNEIYCRTTQKVQDSLEKHINEHDIDFVNNSDRSAKDLMEHIIEHIKFEFYESVYDKNKNKNKNKNK